MLTIKDMIDRLSLFDDQGNYYSGVRPSLVKNDIIKVTICSTNGTIVFPEVLKSIIVKNYEVFVTVTMDMGSSEIESLVWKVKANLSNGESPTYKISVDGRTWRDNSE